MPASQATEVEILHLRRRFSSRQRRIIHHAHVRRSIQHIHILLPRLRIQIRHGLRSARNRALDRTTPRIDHGDARDPAIEDKHRIVAAGIYGPAYRLFARDGDFLLHAEFVLRIHLHDARAIARVRHDGAGVAAEEGDAEIDGQFRWPRDDGFRRDGPAPGDGIRVDKSCVHPVALYRGDERGLRGVEDDVRNSAGRSDGRCGLIQGDGTKTPEGLEAGGGDGVTGDSCDGAAVENAC